MSRKRQEGFCVDWTPKGHVLKRRQEWRKRKFGVELRGEDTWLALFFAAKTKPLDSLTLETQRRTSWRHQRMRLDEPIGKSKTWLISGNKNSQKHKGNKTNVHCPRNIKQWGRQQKNKILYTQNSENVLTDAKLRKNVLKNLTFQCTQKRTKQNWTLHTKFEKWQKRKQFKHNSWSAGTTNSYADVKWTHTRKYAHLTSELHVQSQR